MSAPSPTVLFVATATQWFGTPRIPRDFAKAGWTVAMLCPEGSAADHSRYIDKIAHVPEQITSLDWVYAFAATVKGTAPRLIVPCDDTAVRLLQQLVLAPPDNMQPAVQLELAKLIADSLGNPAYYRVSVNKLLLGPAAEKLGVRVPPYQITTDLAGATAFAAVHGWPVVLKRGHSSAGDGVQTCRNEAELVRAFGALMPHRGPDLRDSPSARLVVQAFIPGRTQFYAATAWRGSVLCGYAVDKLMGEPAGPASVVRYFHSPRLQEPTERLVAGFAVTGIFAPEFIIHEQTGDAYLIEINRRVTPGTHRGSFINISTGAALFAALTGSPATTRRRLDDGEEPVFVSFPHEWLRDAESPYLRDYPVDVPWDEPELLSAMLAMKRAP